MPTIIINAHKEDGAINTVTLTAKVATAKSIWQERPAMANQKLEQLKEELEQVIEKYFDLNYESNIVSTAEFNKMMNNF